MYASCIPDVAADNSVILECEGRLKNLFQRSFPNVAVHGTRRAAASWLADVSVDARCAIGGLPKACRSVEADFPGSPYLVADPERRIQWRALLGSFGKRPKIGVCWSGGSKHNQPKARRVGLESFRSLIDGLDATFVSLQYKDPSAEIASSGLPVHHWKRACETDDYDDTAALVAELDLVVGVHTSVHHLAGALGIPGIILVPEKTLWLYAQDNFPWYKSAKLFRQKQGEPWSNTIQRLHDSGLCRL